MSWLRWVAAAVAASEAGWMLFDGLRALTVGDYVTPKRGEHAGELGPWSSLVSAIGIEPRSTVMKTIFVVYGAAWLAVVAAFAARQPWAWAAMLALAVASLWYLVVGTVASAVVIALLLLPGVRAAY